MSAAEANEVLRGRVVTVTRKYVSLLTEDDTELRGTYPSKTLELVVGDDVEFIHDKSQIVVTALTPRKNLLKRSYRDITKLLAANLDHLFVVSAPPPQWNHTFVDRMLCAAKVQEIPASLLINKSDLDLEAMEPILGVYRKLGITVDSISAKNDTTLETVETFIDDPAIRIVAFAGVSGVGKSTILNRLVPMANRPTAEVSTKTGMGTQTTTQAHGFLRARPPHRPVLIIDLPGVQSFGLSDLTSEELVEGFPDIKALASGCEFDNCSHILEQNCAVKAALGPGSLAPSRYENYTAILNEIRAMKKY